MRLRHAHLRRAQSCVLILGISVLLMASIGPWSIELHRTGCYGTCPDYTLTVWSNGLVHYHGNYAIVTGDYSGYIGPLHAQWLISRFLLSSFPSMQDTYTNGNIDFAGSATCLTLGWLKKCVKIAFDIIPLPAPPAELLSLNALVDQITFSEQWTGTPQQLYDRATKRHSPYP